MHTASLCAFLSATEPGVFVAHFALTRWPSALCCLVIDKITFLRSKDPRDESFASFVNDGERDNQVKVEHVVRINAEKLNEKGQREYVNVRRARLGVTIFLQIQQS